MNEEQKTPINLTLSLGAINMILAALGKAPYEQVADLVQVIRDQAVPQISEQAAPAEQPNP
jgi:hypothetical protein